MPVVREIEESVMLRLQLVSESPSAMADAVLATSEALLSMRSR